MSIRGGKILSTTVTIVGILISLVLVIIGLKMGVFTSPETLQMFLRGAGLWACLLYTSGYLFLFSFHDRRSFLQNAACGSL